MKTPRLSKSKIEYLTHCWNFYSGCENWKRGICGGGGQEFNCWAMARTKRFKRLYPYGFEPTFYQESFLSPLSLKKPSIIGVAFMGDLFGDWINPNSQVYFRNYQGYEAWLELKDAVFSTIRQSPQHTFVFLTKCPWNLQKWSPFPKNCWVGVTATGHIEFAAAYYHLTHIEATVKYISLEPLLNWDSRVTLPMIYQASQAGIDWLIIGGLTQGRKTFPPRKEWIDKIISAANASSIPIFIKDNAGYSPQLREYPKAFEQAKEGVI